MPHATPIHRFLALALNPRAIKAFFTWPKFSLTSYEMLSALVAQGIRPATIIDVGANVGQFAVASAKLLPHSRIYAFEPVADCVRKLRHNTQELPQVKVIAMALGDHTGDQQIHINSHSHSSSLLPLADGHRHAFPEATEAGSESISVGTLDGIAEQLQLKSPCLLKLDVQGYEARVLAGGRNFLQQVDLVVLEASFRPMYQGETLFPELMEIMKEFGFLFSRPIGWLADPGNDEILQMDALFERDNRSPTNDE